MHPRRSHDIIVYSLLEAILDGNNNSERAMDRNTKHSLMFKLSATVSLVRTILRESLDEGLVMTVTKAERRSGKRFSVYELTDKGKQYVELLQKQNHLIDLNGRYSYLPVTRYKK